jgi:hypothetical protein
MGNNISKNISYNEAVRSSVAQRYGLNNRPNIDILKQMKITAENVFQPAREHFNVPLFISSFYRSLAVNRKAGGSSSSSHMRGEAIDIDCDVFGEITNAELFDWLRENVEFDQLIWEFGTHKNPAWVHVSYSEGNNRGQVLVAYTDDKGRTKYKNWE